MTRLPPRDYVYYTTVRGLCRSCREIVPGRIVFRGSEVWQEQLCHRCGVQAALIAGDKEWYLARMSEARLDRSPVPGVLKPHPNRQGCPADCGPCSWHASPCQLPVISVTNNCNLRCPICFTYNRPDKIYSMSPAEMRQIVDWVVAASGHSDVINITGGEPTLHPQIFELIAECRRPEIGRITLNSNGLLLGQDFHFCERLAELGVYVILSFNTFSAECSRALHGQDVVESKLKAIENLTRAGVRMTLLNVLIRDHNEDDLPKLLDLMRSHDNILSLTIQPMTYTGQGGASFTPGTHLPVDVAANLVCQHLRGEIEPSDFVSRPSAHPLCYSLCYLFKLGERLLPFTRALEPSELQEKLRQSYLLRVDDNHSFFTDIVNRLYASNQTTLLPAFKKLIQDLFPSDRSLSHFERQRLAESSVRTIYIHAHMDEDTFDCSRAALCPDLVPCEPGKLIPACTYNLFYRQRDERFYV
ncbi:radical SAM protein [candidate division CSSED10-310 bacterium]|uniref:Radical SAM protein n=1 Tax=candidate division CSSED10-310 bacterium TaxID=2855610 RepID=A0ABV6YZC1_UNCC1